MKRVAITGATGKIGSVLTRGLIGYALTRLGPETDWADPQNHEQLLRAFEEHEAVIHLAWIRPMGPPEPGATYWDLLPADNRHTENLEMSAGMIRAAQEAGVRRVILASSVHADNFYDWNGPGLLSADRVPRPAGPYGAAKVLLEEQGRFHASRGLEVICVRFGAVTASGEPRPTDQWERRIWLSHRDCIAVARACLDAPEVPGGFCVLYAVSDNEGRVHDTRNPFGWRPLNPATRIPETPDTVSRRQTVSFTRMLDQTPEDRALVIKVAQEHNRGFADRMLALLKGLATVPSAHQIDRTLHALQTATRALCDGADEETVVCALFHDVADYFSTENHAAVAAELLHPYISRDNYWMVANHGEFTYGDRRRYRDHPCFERTALFSDRWDQESFDPAYDALGLETFEPMVRRIFARTPYEYESRRA